MRIERARPYVVKALHAALNPRSIAVVGASRNPNKVGYQVCKELMDWHFKGEIIPVNPRATEILGLKAYPTLRDIPHPVDLVFVAVPAHLVKSIIEDAVAAQATCAVVATSNFKETGRADLQDEITSYCREHKLPLIGPNLVGLGSPYDSFNCGFIPYLPIPGHVGMISQSGANLLAALGTSQKDHYGLNQYMVTNSYPLKGDLSKVKSPSERFIAADRTCENSNDYIHAKSVFGYRHNSGNAPNLLYADGHVGQKRRSEIEYLSKWSRCNTGEYDNENTYFWGKRWTY